VKKPTPNTRSTKVPKKEEDRPKTERVHRNWRTAYSDPKSLTVVLDLDHTLVATSNGGFYTANPERRYVIELDSHKLKGSTRPNVSEFLDYLSYYTKNIVVWTAAEKGYANAVVDLLFEDRPKPRILHRDHCAIDERGNYYKPLSRLASELDTDLDSLLMIDDKIHTFQGNPANGLLVPEYHGNDNDDVLGIIRDWLESPHVRRAWSLSQLDKDIFKHCST
jgi:TFIIF-interacting CTD phosphatase-like protein